jgi:hypothetical protein
MPQDFHPLRPFNPSTRVFGYGGTTPKLKRERYVLDEFCKRMRRRHRACCNVMRVRDALRRGLVINVDGSTVDGVLRTSAGPVAIELLGYSPLDDRGDVMVRDLALRKVIKRALYDRLRAKCYSLWLWYREHPRPGPKPSGMVRTVPRERDFRALVKELRSVVADAPALDFNKFLSVRFVRPDLARRARDAPRGLFMDATRFPVCAAHLTQVRLQGLRPWLPPDVGSELSCGFIGIDDRWVREHLASKAVKSLHKSRERAHGLPLWLIVHSDGHAIHQTIHETHRTRALELCREVLAAMEHGFARVYWADRTGFVDAAWVGRVL